MGRFLYKFNIFAQIGVQAPGERIRPLQQGEPAGHRAVAGLGGRPDQEALCGVRPPQHPTCHVPAKGLSASLHRVSRRQG